MRRSMRTVAAVMAALTWAGLATIGGPAAAVASSVTGTVFQDFNSNGANNAVTATGIAKDIGVAGIEVKAYDSTGALVGTATTASDGTYTLNVSGNASNVLRVEFAIPATNPLAAFRSSFAGTDSGTSIQFVTLGATAVNYAINVPGEFCQNNPNLSVSRLCSGSSAATNTSSSAWVTRYDGGPYTTAHTWTDVYNSWTTTTSATKADTGSILGMTWDPSTGRVFHSAYVRRHAEMYEVGGVPAPGAIFVTTPTGTSSTAGVGGTTSFLVDLETLMAGDQFSNSSSSGPGYIPSNSARKLQYFMDGTSDGGAENDGVDSDLITGKDGVFEEVGRAGIGDIENDGNGNLFIVSMYDKNLYKVIVPKTGSPTSMSSLGDISSGVSCTNGNARPFSVKLWREALYLGVICDGESDFNPSSPQTIADTNLTFTIRKYDLSTSSWSTFFGPQALTAAGGVHKGRADTRYSVATYNVWNPWTTTYNNSSVDSGGNGYYWTRPQPMLSEIEFDRDGSMVLSFRDRNGDILGTSGSETPDGGYGMFPSLASGDLYRVCRTGSGYSSSDYVFEGGTGCAQTTNTNHGTEYYWGDYWYDTTHTGHGETSVGLSELVPGFPELLESAYDPKDGDSTGKTFYAGGVRSFLNSTGAPSGTPNTGSGVIFYAWSGDAGNPNAVAGFEKTNGMSDIEALCDQAPIQIGNRVWIDSDKDGIQDPGETPVAGATVRLYAADGTTLLGTAITDANGQYYFASNVTEAAAGTGDNSGGGIAAGSSYIIRMDNSADYTGSGPLVGYVLTTTTATDPVTGLDTSVDNNAATVNSYPQLTTATLQAGVNDHTYDIGFNKLVSSTASTTTVAGGSTSQPVGMGNYTWIDSNRNGIQDTGEAPLAGVVVTLFNQDGTPAKNLAGGAATATTDANGYYFIDNLAAGSYYAIFTLPSGYVFTKQSSTGSTSANDSNPAVTTGKTPVFTIGTSTSGDTVADTDPKTTAVWVNPTIDAGVVPVGKVSVGNYVWRDLNGDGLQGPADHGVKGAKLTLRTADGKPVYDVNGKLVKSQVTKKDGKFLFADLPPGQYVVSITYPTNFFPTTKDRTDRGLNSSSFKATSRVLAAGEKDLTLDFGMVSRSTKILPATR